MRSLDTNKLGRRRCRVAAIATVSMGFLGAVAMAALDADGLLTEPFLTVILVELFCFVVGMVVGVVSIPAVVFGITYKDLRLAVPSVYLPALTAVLIHIRLGSGSLFFPVNTTVSAFAVVVAMSLLARFILPNRFRPIEQYVYCARCGYDLRGARHRRCPECGALPECLDNTPPQVRSTLTDQLPPR